MSRLPFSIAWFLKFATDKENLTVLLNLRSSLLHNKQVPLLHNTVLIYVMKGMDWWPYSCKSCWNQCKMCDPGQRSKNDTDLSYMFVSMYLPNIYTNFYIIKFNIFWVIYHWMFYHTNALRKKVKCQPRVIIWTNMVVLEQGRIQDVWIGCSN